MALITKIAEYLHSYTYTSSNFRKLIRIVCGPQIVCNLNYRNCDQKHFLVCYLSQCFEPRYEHIGHPNVHHANAIINAIIDTGATVDVCYSNDINAYNILKKNNYDYIIGFGFVFNKLLQDHKNGVFINLITENDPGVVSKKYSERINYFYERHPNWKIKHSIQRSQFYKEDTFHLSDIAIVMNSLYNISNFEHPFSNCYPINTNGLQNLTFDISEKLNRKFDSTKFLWFGSSGLIHKGLDILIDAFREFPALTLDVYGVNSNELKDIKDIPKNVKIEGKINVLSEEFNEVALNHTFVLSASCSEGMNTGISTCMLHGIIPVITKETGFNNHDTIIEFCDYKLESIIEVLQKVSSFDNEKLSSLSLKGYEYANNNFTLDAFTISFKKILKEIMSIK